METPHSTLKGLAKGKKTLLDTIATTVQILKVVNQLW